MPFRSILLDTSWDIQSGLVHNQTDKKMVEQLGLEYHSEWVTLYVEASDEWSTEVVYSGPVLFHFFSNYSEKAKDFAGDARFRVDIRKNFFTMKTVKHWRRLPRQSFHPRVHAISIPQSLQDSTRQSPEKPGPVSELTRWD